MTGSGIPAADRGRLQPASLLPAGTSPLSWLREIRCIAVDYGKTIDNRSSPLLDGSHQVDPACTGPLRALAVAGFTLVLSSNTDRASTGAPPWRPPGSTACGALSSCQDAWASPLSGLAGVLMARFLGRAGSAACGCQQQSSPRHAPIPTRTAKAAMPKPVSGSVHQAPCQAAVIASAARTAAAWAAHR